MMRKVFSIFLALLLLGVFAFGYDIYRQKQSGTDKVTQYLTQGVPIAATRCPISGYSFEGGKEGSMYIDGLMMRTDLEQVIQGVPRTVHSVSLDGKIVYSWNDQSDLAFTSSMYDFIYYFASLHLDGGVCKPWFFSDKSIFVIPEDRTFVPYTQ